MNIFWRTGLFTEISQSILFIYLWFILCILMFKISSSCSVNFYAIQKMLCFSKKVIIYCTCQIKGPWPTLRKFWICFCMVITFFSKFWIYFSKIYHNYSYFNILISQVKILRKIEDLRRLKPEFLLFFSVATKLLNYIIVK